MWSMTCPGRAGNEGPATQSQVPTQDGQATNRTWLVPHYMAQLQIQIPDSKPDSQAAESSLRELQLQVRQESVKT